MSSVFDRAASELRRNHQVAVDGWNVWSCSCGRQGRPGWNITAARARADADRHLHAEMRKVLARLRQEVTTTCAWFALCTNEATGTLAHPVLGDVPICDRCRAKYEAT